MSLYQSNERGVAQERGAGEIRGPAAFWAPSARGSGYLRKEFGVTSTAELARIHLIAAEIEPKMSGQQHLRELLEKLPHDPTLPEFVRYEVKRFTEQVAANTELKPLRSEAVFRALLLIVRNWEKTDWHCHVSDSLDDRFALAMTAAKGRSAAAPDDAARNTIKDDWIVSEEQFLAAVAHVVPQYFEDGVAAFALRCNPFKRFSAAGGGGPLLIEEPVMLQRIERLAAVLEQLEHDAGKGRRVLLMFSLNREKYGRDVVRAVEMLTLVKEAAPAAAERMYGIDISGPEMPTWECDANGSLTEAGDRLSAALKSARRAGFVTVSHLGHRTSLAKRDPGSGDFTVCPRLTAAENQQRLAARLRYVTQYLDAVSGIGHGSIIVPFVAFQGAPGGTDISGLPEFRELIEVLRAGGANGSAFVERCKPGSAKTIAEVESEPPFYWEKAGVVWRPGIDGLQRAISLSQWALLLMLARPAGLPALTIGEVQKRFTLPLK